MSAQEETGSSQNETYGAVTWAYKVMARRIAGMFSEEGLTQPQFQALRIVAKKGAVCMREISDAMFVTPANITGIIDRLEARGLLTRAGRKGDRRTTDIMLTTKGKALQGRVAEKYGRFMQNALGVFTQEEQKTLRDLLLKLQEGMSRSEV